MAGDWLKIEASTPDKPEVFEMATALKISPAEAFGRLFLVWRWFDQHTEKGNAANVTSSYLNHISGVSGFAEAMEQVGWLSMNGEGQMGLKLPNFSRHNGQTAKNRVLTARRVATHKKRSANAEVTHTPLPREEKRRSKNKTTPPHDGGTTVWDFGRALLIEQGLSAKSAGALIGSWLRDWTEADVAESLRLSAGKADVRSYVYAILKAKPKKASAGGDLKVAL